MLSEEQLQRADAFAEEILQGFMPVRNVSVFELCGMLRKTVSTIRELQAHETELARLGRMVKEMPVHSLLCHELHYQGEWYAELPYGQWFFDKEYGATPEEALDAARKKNNGG